ncbi:MAG: hypothetical protein L3J35_07635 [Bacteroidales bacterium]|nr:hypothetical protein [Bacteroidales bacterium]
MDNIKLNVWSKKIKTEIDSQIDDIFKRDYKFYKIDRLERIAEKIDAFSDNCSECESLKNEVEDIVANLTKSLKSGSPKLRSEYEKRNEKIVNHLKKVHNLSYKEYYASSYSFIGFATGTILFTAIFWFINSNFLLPASLFGFTFGIIIGRIIGKKKDREQEQNNLIL